MPAPWIFTFYSYKGGVGRSLAAVNVAYALAGRGRHVLLIDMDLEAPGISGFLDHTKELDPPQTSRQNDVLTLLGELVSAYRTGGTDNSKVLDLPPISAYARPVSQAKILPLAPKIGELGRLDVLGVDQGRNYTERLAALGLHHLDHNALLGISRLLRLYLKEQRFLNRPSWLETFQESIPTPYDYVIVDSRTGLTEIGGLCVGPLADRLVVITGLNDQNVEGTRTFLDEVGIKLEVRRENQTRWDEADEGDATLSGEPALGPKPTIVVASPVPAGEIEAKRRRLDEIRKRLGVVPEQISYHPQMALMESVFVRDYREEYLTSQYQRLADRMQSRVGDDQGRLMTELSQFLGESSGDRNWMRALDLARRLAPLSAAGSAFLTVVARAIPEQFYPVAIPLWALLSKDRSVAERALNSWGNALSDQAKAKQGETADYLFAAAYEKYAEAVRLKPDFANALSNWGVALADQAKAKQGKAADHLFAAAIEKYAEAVRLKPDFADALSNWGAALSEQGKTKQGEASDHLFAAAYEKYAEAVRLKPDFADALSNWGGALADQAEAKQGEAADHLFAAAYEKYAEAVRLKPDFGGALSNWGNALAAQAVRIQRDSARKADVNNLLNLARAKLLEAIAKGARNGPFNLACLEAIRGDVSESISWLKRALESGDAISQLKIAHESDFDSVRESHAFTSFVATLPNE